MYLARFLSLRERFLRNLYALYSYICSYPLLVLSVVFTVSTGLLIMCDLNLKIIAILVAVGLIVGYKEKAILFPVMLGLTMSFLRVYWADSRIEAGRATAEKLVLKKADNFHGYISKQPEIKEGYVETEMKADFNDRSDPIKVLVKLNRYEEYFLGQVCSITGEIKIPENFNDFNYRRYLEKKGIYLIVEAKRYDCFPIAEKRMGNRLSNSLYDIKKVLLGRLEQMFHEPHSSLIAGILFGEERYFEEGFEESLRISGTTHIIAASGYNVTLLISSIERILSSFISKRRRILISILIIWLFANFSGLSPSIVRACIMSSLILLTIYTGNVSSIDFIIPVTVLIYSIYDPFILASLSFQLSILSTISLIYFLPILSHLLLNNLKPSLESLSSAIKEYLMPTLACTLGTLPILIYNFGTISLVGVFANVLILPVVGSSMLFGALTLAIPDLFSAIRQLFISVVYTQMNFFEYVVKIFSDFNHALVHIGSSFFALPIFPFLSYGILIFLTIAVYQPENEKLNYYLSLYERRS